MDDGSWGILDRAHIWIDLESGEDLQGTIFIHTNSGRTPVDSPLKSRSPPSFSWLYPFATDAGILIGDLSAHSERNFATLCLFL